MGQAFLVTGTDTGIGKTTVASGVAAALTRRGWDVGVVKPVETGCAQAAGSLVPADALRLRWAAGREAEPLGHICPFRLREPLAPAVAARREGMRLELGDLVEAVRKVTAGGELTIVEGAGGLLVPLAGEASFADLARACGLPLLIVVGNRLGAINHARLTVDCARQAGLQVIGYVMNTLGPESSLAAQTNMEVLAELFGPSLGVFPFLPPAEWTAEYRERLADAAEEAIDLDRLITALQGS